MNITVYTPEQLNADYDSLMTKSVKFSEEIAAGVKMADLASAQEELTNIVMEIDNASQDEGNDNFFSKVFRTSKQKVERELLKQKSVKEVTERMFNSLSVRKDNLYKAVGVLDKIESVLAKEHLDLCKVDVGTQVLLEDRSQLTSVETMTCMDVGTQVGIALTKNEEHQRTVATVISASMELTNQVSQHLPKLQRALNSELTMSQALSEIRQFKDAFDKTTEAIDKISDSNNDAMFEVLEAVLDVSTRDQQEISRLKERQKITKERQAVLKKKVQAQREHKENYYDTVQALRKESAQLQLEEL